MKILNIDDSTVNNMLMENTLNALGYESFSVLKGEEALEKIEEYQPDLIILDIMMPTMSGIDVLEQINQNDIKIPVIVISALSDPALKKRALELGAIDYQQKPVKINTLESIINLAFQA